MSALRVQEGLPVGGRQGVNKVLRSRSLKGRGCPAWRRDGGCAKGTARCYFIKEG